MPILTSHTILRAAGKDCVEGADIAKVDANWQLCQAPRAHRLRRHMLAVAPPLVDVLWQAGCEMAYVPALGGQSR